MRLAAYYALNQCQTDLIGRLIREVVPIEKNAFKILILVQQKYLTTKKYLEDPRRCKIKLDNFVFFTKLLIFPLLLELEIFEDFKKYLEKKIFSLKILFLKALQLQQEQKNQFGEENKSCPEFDFTSSRVLQIFFSCQIFLLYQFQYFESIFLKRDFSDLMDNEVCQALVQSTICHVRSNFLIQCVGVIKCKVKFEL